MEKGSVKVMATNREARHEYFIEEEYEAGIELVGTEVKSIRAGTLNLKDAWCGIKDGQLLLRLHASRALDAQDGPDDGDGRGVRAGGDGAGRRGRGP